MTANTLPITPGTPGTPGTPVAPWFTPDKLRTPPGYYYQFVTTPKLRSPAQPLTPTPEVNWFKEWSPKMPRRKRLGRNRLTYGSGSVPALEDQVIDARPKPIGRRVPRIPFKGGGAVPGYPDLEGNLQAASAAAERSRSRAAWRIQKLENRLAVAKYGATASGIRSGTFPARRGGGKCGGNLCGGSLHVCGKRKGGAGFWDMVKTPEYKKWAEEQPRARKVGGGTSRDLFYKRFTLPMRQGGAVRHRKRRSHRKRRCGGSFIA